MNRWMRATYKYVRKYRYVIIILYNSVIQSWLKRMMKIGFSAFEAFGPSSVYGTFLIEPQ